MSEGPEQIPPPPREPRWRTCLARYWVVGLIGFLLLDTGLTFWVFLLATRPNEPPPRWVLGAVALPGLAIMGYWFRGVLRLRVMLREGSLTSGLLVSVTRLFGLNPPHLRVRYRYRDEAGPDLEVTQYVRAGSPLGKRLREHPQTVPVVHDPLAKGHSRVVGPEDFLWQ